jgi:hypothetical protein
METAVFEVVGNVRGYPEGFFSIAIKLNLQPSLFTLGTSCGDT